MISIVTQPNQFEPSYNYLKYKVSSSNSGNQNFKFTIDIQISGQTIMSLANPPAPDGYLYFDAGRIAENYLSYDSSQLLDNTGQAAVLCPNSYINDGFRVLFGESYSNITVTGTTTGSTIYPFNGSLSYKDRIDFQSAQLTEVSTAKKFLTNMPYQTTLTRSQNQYLTFIRDTLTGCSEMSVTCYYYNEGAGAYDVLNDPITINLNKPLLTIDGGKMLRIPAGYNLQGISPSLVTGGSLATLLDPTCGYYTISLFGTTAGTQTSEAKQFWYRDDVCRFTPKEFIFQNRWGAFESFVFQLVSTKKQTSGKKFYHKNNPYGQMDYRIGDRIATSLSVDVNETFTCLSNWISPDESEWLKELISSPVVFIREDDDIRPVNILTSDYDIYTDENKNLFNIKIEYEYTTLDSIQRG